MPSISIIPTLVSRVLRGEQVSFDLSSPLDCDRLRRRLYAWASRNPGVPGLRASISGSSITLSLRQPDHIAEAVQVAMEETV